MSIFHNFLVFFFFFFLDQTINWLIKILDDTNHETAAPLIESLQFSLNHSKQKYFGWINDFRRASVDSFMSFYIE